MHDDLDSMLAFSRSAYYLLGAFVVTLAVFTTAARKPAPRCPKCTEHNRPMARFCANCGHPLNQK